MNGNVFFKGNSIVINSCLFRFDLKWYQKCILMEQKNKTTNFLDILYKKKKKNSKYLCNDMFD